MRIFAGGIVGGFLGLTVWFGIWWQWEATVYRPWLDQQIAQGDDDGGSSEGLVLLLGVPPALMLGIIIGAILSHLIYAMWLNRRKARSR